MCSCQGGVQDTKQLTLTCAKELSFPFDSWFSLKTKQNRAFIQLGVDTSHSCNFRAQGGYSLDIREGQRTNIRGRVSRLTFKVVCHLLLHLYQQRNFKKEKGKKKKTLFLSWLLFASFVLFLTVWGFQMHKDFTLSWHFFKELALWGLEHSWKCRIANVLFRSLSQHIRTSGASKSV